MPVSTTLVMGAANVASSAINSTISGLFQSGVLKSQQQAIEIKSKLDVLSNQQQDILNQELAAAKTDTDRMAILTNAVAGIKESQNSDAAKSQTTVAFLLLGSGIALLITAIVYKKYA